MSGRMGLQSQNLSLLYKTVQVFSEQFDKYIEKCAHVFFYNS